MPVNLDSQNISNQANLAANLEESSGEVSSINKTSMHITEGVAGTSEVNDSQGTNSSSAIPSLEAPTLPLEEVLETPVKLDAVTAQLLGVSEGVKMNMAQFNKAILDKLESKFSISSDATSTTGGLDVSKLDAEALDLFCLLLTQSSKEKMIKTFKGILETKIQERNDKQQAYIKEVNEVTQKNLDAVEAAKKAEKKAKKWGIFKAILAAVVAVITTAIAVGVTAASMGSMGPVALTIASLAIAAALASCAFTVASSGCTIAAQCTEDPELKSRFNKLSMGFGVAAMACGIVSAICSGGTSFFSGGVSMLGKILGGISSVVSGCSQMASGAGDIVLGVENIKLAELQKELANMKIDLAKLDETIALLNKLIETLTNTSEDLIKNLLEGEQQAAKELINVAQTQSELADEITAKGV